MFSSRSPGPHAFHIVRGVSRVRVLETVVPSHAGVGPVFVHAPTRVFSSVWVVSLGTATCDVSVVFSDVSIIVVIGIPVKVRRI